LRLVEQARLPQVKALVNDVLRRIARVTARGMMGDRDPAHSMRRSGLGFLVGSYGEDATRAIAPRHIERGRLSTSRPARRRIWEASSEASCLHNGHHHRLPSGWQNPRPAGLREGAWWVQDAAAAIKARLLGDIASKKGRRSLRRPR